MVYESDILAVGCEASDAEKRVLSLPPNHAINPQLSMLDFKEQVEIANTKATYQELDNVGEEEDEEPTSPGMEKVIREQSVLSMIPFDDTTH